MSKEIQVMNGDWKLFMAFCAKHAEEHDNDGVGIALMEIDDEKYLHYIDTNYYCKVTDEELEEYEALADELGAIKQFPN